MKKLILGVTAVMLLATQTAHADHASVSGGIDITGPINTIGAATLPQGKFSTGLTMEFVKSKTFSDDELTTLAGQHVHAHSADYTLITSYGLSYGVTDDLMLSLNLPWVHRDNIRAGHHSHGPAGNTVDEHGNSRGIGDLTLTGQYKFWENEPAAWQTALLLGMKMPTGETDETNAGEKLDAEHQPGSGSWDPLFGLATTKQIGRYAVDANVLYVLATEGAQNTDLGDRISYNLAVSHRLGGELHHHNDGTDHQHKALDLTLEMNGLCSNRKEEDDVADRNSGGNEIFLSPGFRYVAESGWAAQLSLGIPVVSNLGKGHADTDYRLTVGINRAF